MPSVSTGGLPGADMVEALVAEAHHRYRTHEGGRNSLVYPALARVPSHLFGVRVVATNGDTYQAGDAEVEFTIMSAAKPFVFALVCRALGREQVRETATCSPPSLRSEPTGS